MDGDRIISVPPPVEEVAGGLAGNLPGSLAQTATEDSKEDPAGETGDGVTPAGAAPTPRGPARYDEAALRALRAAWRFLQ